MNDQAPSDPIATKHPGVIVIAAGLFTSVIALAIVGAIAWYSTFDLMGLYMLFVIPVGAVVVGLDEREYKKQAKAEGRPADVKQAAQAQLEEADRQLAALLASAQAGDADRTGRT
jgi:hypothetical protein